MRYATVILPLALEGTFTYRVPAEFQAKIQLGMRAIVPFGKRRYYTGIVASLSDEAPEIKQGVKEISYLPDGQPLLPVELLARWTWIADYYLCTLGEVLLAAMPRGLLPESSSMLYLCEDFEAEARLSLREQALLDCLAANKGKAMSLSQVERALGGGSLAHVLSKLLSLGALSVEERLQYQYKAKELPMIRLAKPYQSDEALSKLIDSIKRAPKQQALLLRMAEFLDEAGLSLSDGLSRKQLSEEKNSSTLIRALKERGVIEEYFVELSRLASEDAPDAAASGHADAADQARRLRSECSKPACYLLQCSDYRLKEAALIELIVQELEAGGSVLLLSPTANRAEDTESLAYRLRQRIGNRVFNYHALRSDAERVEIWQEMSQSKEPYLLMGMRAAVLLPTPSLSLVIVDAEHEYIYKQQDPAPRYHARDLAIWIAHQVQCPIILASETPSAESLLNLIRGKNKALHLASEPMQPFKIETLDMKLMQRQRRISWQDRLSPPLLQALSDTLSNGQMSLVLQNRRGYAPQVLCQACGEAIRCLHCDVSLSFHKASRSLLCHYCGYRTVVPRLCPACGAVDPETNGSTLRISGYGAERVEEELREKLPKARILRIDSDMIKSKKNRIEIEERLADASADILVGTQLIKGQNCGRNVALVAIVELDSILAYPDFRSYERAFQLIYQLLIRSGANCLLLQTMNPDNPFIAQLATASYERFIAEQLEERKALSFPPFRRLISLRLKSAVLAPLEEMGTRLSQLLRSSLPEAEVSDLISPSVSRVQSMELRQILIKVPHTFSSHSLRRVLRNSIEQIQALNSLYKRVGIQFDVDPH